MPELTFLASIDDFEHVIPLKDNPYSSLLSTVTVQGPFPEQEI